MPDTGPVTANLPSGAQRRDRWDQGDAIRSIRSIRLPDTFGFSILFYHSDSNYSNCIAPTRLSIRSIRLGIAEKNIAVLSRQAANVSKIDRIGGAKFGRIRVGVRA